MNHTHSNKGMAYSELDQFIQVSQHVTPPKKNYQASKEKLIESISHDLRTPLTSILMLSQILQKHIDDPEKILIGLKRIERQALLQKRKIDDALEKIQTKMP